MTGIGNWPQPRHKGTRGFVTTFRSLTPRKRVSFAQGWFGVKDLMEAFFSSSHVARMAAFPAGRKKALSSSEGAKP